jgi:acyl carrier protein
VLGRQTREESNMSNFKEDAVQAIVERLAVVFDKEPREITTETNLEEDLGAKSTNISQLANFLEDIYDVQVSFVELRKRKTVADIAEFIEKLCED